MAVLRVLIGLIVTAAVCGPTPAGAEPYAASARDAGPGMSPLLNLALARSHLVYESRAPQLALALRSAPGWGGGTAAGGFGRHPLLAEGPLTVLAVLRPDAAHNELQKDGWVVNGQVGRVASVVLSRERVGTLAVHPDIMALMLPPPLRMHLDVNGIENGAIAARQLTGLTGAGVIVAVIDSGIDYTHEDFRNPDGTTRIKFLWDQVDGTYAASGGSVGSPPPVLGEDGRPLGTVYTEAQLNAAIRGDGVVNSLDLVGHGTLVASAAAGDGSGEPGGIYVGVAPNADIIVVRAGGVAKTDLSITGNLVAALQWIDERAAELGEPVVVNLSFGGHVGPHDGTTPEEIAVDEFVKQPGHAVVVSAGNEGADNIHASGSAVGSHALRVFQGGAVPFIVIDCWLRGADTVDLGFRDPNDNGVDDLNVRAGQCAIHRNPVNTVSACVGEESPLDGEREAVFLVEPTTIAAPISPGGWQFFLRDEGGIEDGTFHCWSGSGQEFSADVDPAMRVAQPGTAKGAITVGALSARSQWESLEGPSGDGDLEVGALANFSSPGPSRDGRVKPDLVTGGEYLVGAWSAGDGSGSGIAGVPPDPDRVAASGVHVAARGTSFAAPQVAGAIALLLERAPSLSAAEIRSYLVDTARRDTFTGPVPNPNWGFGKIDIVAALAVLPELPVPTSTPTVTATPLPSSSNTPSPVAGEPATPTRSPVGRLTPTPQISFRGDANCDGVLSGKDLVAAIAAVFQGGGWCWADCNQDGEVTAADVACVRRVLSAQDGALAASPR